MAILSYKTRDGSDPQGKPRVYFCCHGKNLSGCFQDICQDIFATQNCAVWYFSGGTRDEVFWDDLQNMQLFVLPVTVRLLSTDNAAMEEFRFAVDNHIPVLPLLQEAVPDALFREKCGDLQYLDKHQADATAISYPEKLQQFLNGVLLGDELIGRIREAFDGYIFLSYRKKDRKLAQDLMELVHRNDFCRDVAIWYDEFLTPGEDFNESIRQALQKSKLFLLTVTPNLVNERNYVMTTEYPMAVRAKKPVLPVQMVKTSRWKLFRHFKGLGRLADARNEKDLSRLLKQRLKGLPLRQQNGAEHAYLIGLAYLGGVDVEVDHQKAVALITCAADAGLPAAIEKLAHMYRAGLGVDRSYDQSLSWREKGILAAEKAYREEPSADSLNMLFWCCSQCAGAYEDLSRLDKALEKYQQALDFMQQADPKLTDQLCRNYAAGYSSIGAILMKKGESATARQYATEGLRFAVALMLEDDTPATRRDVSVSYEKLGHIYLAEDDAVNARKCFEQSRRLRLALLHSNRSEEAMRDLMVSSILLGDVYFTEGDLTNARQQFTQALDLAKELQQLSDTQIARRDHSVCLERMGNVCFAQEDHAAARQYWQQCLDYDLALAEENGTPAALRDLSILYQKLGQLCQAEGDLITARQYSEESLRLAQSCREACDTVQDKWNVADCHAQLGNICMDTDDLTGAQQHFEECLHLREALFRESDVPAYQESIATAHMKLAMVCDDPRSCLMQALAIYNVLLQHDPDNDQYQHNHQLILAALATLPEE